MKPQYLPVPPVAAYTGWVDLGVGEDASWLPVVVRRLRVEATLAIKVSEQAVPAPGREYWIEVLTLSGLRLPLAATPHPGERYGVVPGAVRRAGPARLVVLRETAEATITGLARAAAVERICRWLEANPEQAHGDGCPVMSDAGERDLFEAVRAGWLAETAERTPGG